MPDEKSVVPIEVAKAGNTAIRGDAGRNRIREIEQIRALSERRDRSQKLRVKLGIKLQLDSLKLIQSRGEKLVDVQRAVDRKKMSKGARDEIKKQLDLTFDELCTQIEKFCKQSSKSMTRLATSIMDDTDDAVTNG